MFSRSLPNRTTTSEKKTVGLGTMVMMPVIGNSSDKYGIKAMLTLPMCLCILPPAILGYRRDTNFFYAFYIIKILFDMVCYGTVDCLAYAYMAKNVHGRKRIGMFGVLAGVRSIAGVCANFSARFLPIASTFQVSAISSFIGLVYMRVFLKERLHDDDDDYDYDENDDDDDGSRNHEEVYDGDDLVMLAEPILEQAPTKTLVFNNKMLSTELLMEFCNAACLSIAWSAWVPYATTVLVPGGMFVMPSVCGIASKQVGSGEQGKVQGCISGVKSLAGVVAPFVYSPLTALFLSENAPFYFPGFSLLCVAFSLMIGFIQSLLIKDIPSPIVN